MLSIERNEEDEAMVEQKQNEFDDAEEVLDCRKTSRKRPPMRRTHFDCGYAEDEQQGD